jgi:hypothetical protein
MFPDRDGQRIERILMTALAAVPDRPPPADAAGGRSLHSPRLMTMRNVASA